MADIAYEAKYLCNVKYEAFYITEYLYKACYEEEIKYEACYQNELNYPAEYENILIYEGEYDMPSPHGATSVVVTPLQNEGTPIADIDVDGLVSHLFSGPSGQGTNDYEQLVNKPQINEVTLIGNKNLPDIGVDRLTVVDISRLFD